LKLTSPNKLSDVTLYLKPPAFPVVFSFGRSAAPQH